MSEQAILSIRNLQKIFARDLFAKPQKAVVELSCDFPEGKCTGFMGHNGAGKTTTIKTIFGLLKPTKGDILFRGSPIDQKAKKNIGYMPEINKLPGNLTSYEILIHHLRIFRPNGIASKDFPSLVEAKLKEVELWEHRNKRVSKLSKGMGRRLSWSQATIHNPDLVILDEPFSGLDPLGRSLMSSLIADLRAKKKSIILCTHELWSVNEVCDELHILKKGHLAYSTVNPVAQQVPKPLFNYKLTLSGIDQATIEALQESSSLPSWEYVSFKNYLATLGFDEYVDAAQWMEAATKGGIVIVEFEKHKGFVQSELVPFFSGEQS